MFRAIKFSVVLDKTLGFSKLLIQVPSIRLSPGGAAVTMTGCRYWNSPQTRHEAPTVVTNPRRQQCPPGAGWWSGDVTMT